jgi:hypothetical protein
MSPADHAGFYTVTDSLQRFLFEGVLVRGEIVHLDATWRVTEDGFRSKSANSWLLGETLRGSVVKTIAENVALKKKLDALRLGPSEFFRVDIDDKTALDGLRHGARSPLAVHSPRPFQPALGSSMRPSKPLA